jgi:hypothetical protein
MSIEVLKQELAGLAPADRSRITAFLLSLQDGQDAAYRGVLAGKIDDRDPKRWVSIDELDRRLAAKQD